MIIYDLKCKKGHKFEGWFKDRANYEDQRLAKLVTCPICGDTELDIVPSALAIMGKEVNPGKKESSKELSPQKALQLLYKHIDGNFQDVGDKFSEVALSIHRGEEEERNIRGTTTASEEEVLEEEGVKFHKIPLLKFDS
ncbi:MAG: DUF1178 family protein [Smithellaceae bacterium]|nr:DUF1178 family protein [Smithellaceae bacterium]